MSSREFLLLMKPVKWLALLALALLLTAVARWRSPLLPVPAPRAGRGPVPVLHNTMRPSCGPKSVRPVGGLALLAHGQATPAGRP